MAIVLLITEKGQWFLLSDFRNFRYKRGKIYLHDWLIHESPNEDVGRRTFRYLLRQVMRALRRRDVQIKKVEVNDAVAAAIDEIIGHKGGVL